MFLWIDGLGAKAIGVIVYTSHVLTMTYLSFRAALFHHSQGFRTIFSVVSAQIYFTGFQAIPLISVLAVAAGSLVIMQSSFQLSLLGGPEMIGNIFVAVILRELAPLLTALIVIARSGTAVASELGNMRVNREIEALEAMGIHPLSYIVFPRLFGGIVSVLCLAVYFSFVAMMGGFMVTKLMHNMSFDFFFDSLANAFAAEDVLLFILKNTFSGLIIFTVSCYQGLSVQIGSHEVPQVTTKAVVHSIIYVTTFNAIVTTLFYLNQLMKMGVV